MNEQNDRTTMLDKDLEIEDMQEFLLENQGIKLENLPRYEDLIQPEVKQDVKFDDLQEVNTLPFFEPRTVKKEETPTQSTDQKRFKIAASCFAIIGVLFMLLVLINGVSLALLVNESNNNQKEITTLTEEVVDLEQSFSNIDGGEAEDVGYKLALPRNYPDNTADLTWFDKLSIFLMKLFG